VHSSIKEVPIKAQSTLCKDEWIIKQLCHQNKEVPSVQTSTSFKCNRFHIDFEYLFFHEIQNHQNHQ